MVNKFSYFQSTKIVFGVGEILNIASLLDGLEKKLLVVTDKNIGAMPFFSTAVDSLKQAGFTCLIFDDVEPNPSIQTCDKAAILARDGCGAVVAVGGGSVIDVGKSAAMLATNPGGIQEYLLGYDTPAKDIVHPLLPLVAVPTTSGTGSEVSRTIVITDTVAHTKNMRFSTEFYPRYAVVDPELTLRLPPSVTAATGMDALAHVMETYLSSVSNPFTGILALDAMRKIFLNLPRCVNDPDLDCRSELAMASMIGGLCLDGGPCQLPHAIAGMFAVRHGLPHGTSCAIFLPAQIEFLKAHTPDRFKTIMDTVFPEEHCTLENAGDKLIEKVCALMDTIGMQRDIDAPVPEETFIQAAVQTAMRNAAIQVSPREVKPEDLRAMILSIYKQ